MKKRLHNPLAGIIILAVLFVISAATVVLHGSLPRDIMFSMINLGQPLATAIFSLILIFLAVTKRDRLFFIICGGWLAYFVISQFFLLPGELAATVSTIIHIDSIALNPFSAIIATLLHMLSMVGIICIGVLLVEYLNDGSIYNRAFNILCIATVVMLLAYTVITLIHMNGEDFIYISALVLTNFSKITMVFLFSFFAYDSAKAHLEKQKN